MTWTTASLEDLVECIIDYRGKSPPKSPSGIPVISAKVVKTSGIIRPIEQMIAPDVYATWMRRGFPRPGDVVMTTEGPLGEVIQLDEETARFALGQRIVCLRGREGVLDNTFLRYLLTSPAQQQVLASYATGTTVEGISQRALRKVPISHPDFDEQVRIGATLAALDSRIELNRRMSATLQAIAQAVFNDWFIDFGVVQRKMAHAADPVAWMGGLVRDPARAATLAALFPDALTDEGVPVGWRWGAAEELIEFNPVERLKKGCPAPYLDMGSLPTAGPTAALPAVRLFTSGMRFRNGDALLARITPCLENGKSCYVDMLAAGEVGWGSTEFIVLRARGAVPKPLSYLLCRDPAFRARAVQSMTGTSGRQRAQLDSLKRWPMAVPSAGALRAFASFVEPLFARITSAAAESRTLVGTRDLLLPRLISGDVRIANGALAGKAA
jgi:type I restriction enzyme S subunit